LKSILLIFLVTAVAGAGLFWKVGAFKESVEQAVKNAGCADFGDGNQTCCPEKLYKTTGRGWTHLYCVKNTGWEGVGIYGPRRNKANGPHAILKNGRRWRRGGTPKGSGTEDGHSGTSKPTSATTSIGMAESADSRPCSAEHVA
jgi:hypothetical protein